MQSSPCLPFMGFSCLVNIQKSSSPSTVLCPLTHPSVSVPKTLFSYSPIETRVAPELSRRLCWHGALWKTSCHRGASVFGEITGVDSLYSGSTKSLFSLSTSLSLLSQIFFAPLSVPHDLHSLLYLCSPQLRGAHHESLLWIMSSVLNDTETAFPQYVDGMGASFFSTLSKTCSHHRSTLTMLQHYHFQTQVSDTLSGSFLIHLGPLSLTWIYLTHSCPIGSVEWLWVCSISQTTSGGPACFLV